MTGVLQAATKETTHHQADLQAMAEVVEPAVAATTVEVQAQEADTAEEVRQVEQEDNDIQPFKIAL
jgi:hypothetical protein